MLGAIVGDIVGSIYEWDNIKTKKFPLFQDTCFFTDDTVCTVALADCIMNEGNPTEYLQDYCRKYPNRGYGGMFADWIELNNPQPYHSFGNGSAMRISPVANYLNDWDIIEKKTIEYTEVTHNHSQGVIGAMAVSEAIFKGRNQSKDSYPNKEYLVDILMKYYPSFDVSETVDSLRTWYRFNETCQGTVPQALICTIYSTSFEDAIRNAISIGGDSDTLAAIVGSMAEAFYGEIPDVIVDQTMRRLPKEFISIIQNFYDKRI